MKKEKEAAIKALRKDIRIRKLLTEIPKELSEKFTFSLRDLAKRHGISYGKASKLVEKWHKNGILVIKAIPNYHVLGLKPIFTIIKPKDEKWLAKAFSMTYFKFGSWVYGNGKYALVILAPPIDKVENHLSYIEENIGKIKEYYILNRLLPSAPILDYLFMSKTPWSKLPMREAREILYRIVFDKIDVESLSRLEQDGLTRITDLARDLKVNRKTLEYRLRTRVKNIIEGFSLQLNTFDYEEAPKYLFVVTGDYLYKFSSLISSPYPTEVYMGDKIVIIIINLPNREKIDFLDYISTNGKWIVYQIAPGWRTAPLRAKALIRRNTWSSSITL